MKVNDETIFGALIIGILLLCVLTYYLGVNALAAELTLDCYDKNQITLDDRVFYCIREDELNAN